MCVCDAGMYICMCVYARAHIYVLITRGLCLFHFQINGWSEFAEEESCSGDILTHLSEHITSIL